MTDRRQVKVLPGGPYRGESIEVINGVAYKPRCEGGEYIYHRKQDAFKWHPNKDKGKK